ncbi:thiamine pyrophosphate-binding protein [Paraburkholderia saeva]|uniref:Acetolactate synthase isozyme 2 large subunit n=1 Tax=Paraburkholderia saeva TaxID=2777537 RepID=A0A9N8RSS1_9BURK|nr:thiamine pyrophosphate-binding protein [Paraburkholderia saeva]CAG4887970.1 Acetolactate synthase isozyme 2 large subunit [Paraburkholderia saeva]CAG4901579.1 Acetolactate synthase isozyme 2 large subunit [Paraburkholderia saeva]
MSNPTFPGTRNGGQIVVAALLANGVDTVYCVPGESYLPVLDALRDATSIRTYVARHEGAAANMADAYGKLTGRPGICFVTRGPGATHASIGVHTASQDSTPMILFIGQVDTLFSEREAFQEVDYRRMFGGMAKWVTEIQDLARIPEVLARAFSVARSGRPGPVVIALPEDVLFASGIAHDAGLSPATQPGLGAGATEAFRGLLANASQPLLVVGGSGWDEAACADLRSFAEAFDIPVAASFRRQDLFDNRHANYVGQIGLGVSPQLADRVRSADLVIALGTRLAEVTSDGYTLFQSPLPKQTLVHVHADAGELGRVYQPALAINCGMREFARALAAMPATDVVWHTWTASARADYERHSGEPASDVPTEGVDMTQVLRHLNATLPDDAIIANGAGNYTVWVHRYYRYRTPRTELAPTSGAMGYGLPAAVAAKLQHPGRTVVCFAGDGCFMMYPQELATAVQYGAALIVIVVNNGMLGTIRMHQEREYPGRVASTDLRNPDFVTLATAFGAFAERVERSEDFPAAFARAQASGVAALIELRVDPFQITPGARLPA